MKKLFFMVVLLASAALNLQAQNIQLHYDFGHYLYKTTEADRQRLTLTLEQFKADRWGSWFYFVDLDINTKALESAYTEIAREFNLGKQSPFAVHLEFDGGLSQAGTFQPAALLGGAYNFHSSDFSKIFGVQVMYKQYFQSEMAGTRNYASFQLTGIWTLHFAGRALTFTGFIDFWRGEDADHKGELVIFTEPQLWFNLNTLSGMKDVNLSIGTEWEISNNFIFNAANERSFFFNPTLAVKWTF